MNPTLDRSAMRAVVFAIPLALLASSAAASGPLQIYGLQLDTTRFGDRFCEARTENDPGPFECKDSMQSLPKIAEVESAELPAPYVALTFKSAPDDEPEKLTIWYVPRNLGGQSFLISTTTMSTRGEVLRDFGDPTVEFAPADLESRGLHVMDLTLDILLFVDPDLPKADRDRMAKRLKTEFDPAGDELFFLADSGLETLASLLGSDFRGAIVQVAESGFGHHSSVTTILVDLRRAAEVFNLAPE